MRPNRLVTMDFDQLRGWASFMDRAMIASLIATVVAVAALATTTWMSFRYGSAVRAHEQASVEQHKVLESHAAQLEQDVSASRERVSALEQQVAAARERTAALERQVASERERAAGFEQAAHDANERASAAASEKVKTPASGSGFGASEIRQRLADVGKMVREAAARATDPGAASRLPPPSALVMSLRKYTGTKAAVFIVGQVADAAAIGATISGELNEAGWASAIWTWSGVAGIVGVVVLTRDGSDAATIEAASAATEALRTAGFNATKGDWPANWGRFRGVLNGPEKPSPTDASIRIVIGSGSKAR
jgi:hypothetical protein